MTDAYLAPIKLRDTTLTLIYSTISLPSWAAGSHQVSCSIGATLGNGGWSTLLNSAKGPLMINGQPPIPPPDIPEERLNLPPIPMPDSSSGSSSPSRARSGSSGSSSRVGLVECGRASSSESDVSSGSSRSDDEPARRPAGGPGGRPPGQGNTFLNTAAAARRRLTSCRRHPRRRPTAPPPPAPPVDRRCRPRRRRRCRVHRSYAAAAGGLSPMTVRMSPQRFDELVGDALDLIPPQAGRGDRQRGRPGRPTATRTNPICSVSTRASR